MRRLRPVSDQWGYDRGTPVDRWYIDDFLGRFARASGYAAGDVRGRVMEVGGDDYARALATYDGPDAVTAIEVLHVSSENPKATVVGDLTTGDGVPTEAFDCIICTQTLHVLYDVHAAVRTIHAALRPGGTALVTVPGITRSCIPDRDYWGDYWRLTSQGAARLFGDVFGPEHVRTEPYGNLLTALGFLQGMAAEEFADWELRLRDPDYEVIVGIRAQKPASG
jgi:SAM-dependent methyltransferase